MTSAIATEPELSALAGRLADLAARGAARGLLRLDGGRNNRVYRVTMQDGPPLALKSYFSDPRDPRDRLAAEWGSGPPRSTPPPISFSP